MSEAHILLVDDDPDFLKLLGTRLERADYRVSRAENARQALTRVQNEVPDLVITDLRMDGMDGIELLDRLQREHPLLPVLIITADGTIPEAVTATQRGAVGFVSKPVDGDELLARIRSATRLYRSGNDADDPAWPTRNRRMQALLGEAQAAAQSNASILIQGETGTGKELLARFIHNRSSRASAPYIAVNCAAIPAQLLESELFGHVKGAFTGATSASTGLIRSADGGTLFLDEIGDMPLDLQAKLLRVLEERVVRPVGSAIGHPVDLRLVSATHRNLARAIEEGGFRSDLYYRVNVLALSLPSLAQRCEDIPLLVQGFLGELCSDADRKVYAPDAMELLMGAPWPGNVRQLRNVVERNVALSPAGIISREQVRDALGDDAAAIPSFDEAREVFTRDYLMQLIRFADGNITRAAKLAQRNRTDFHKLMKRYGIERDDLDA